MIYLMKAPPRPHNGTVRIEAVPRRSLKAGTLSSDRCWEVRVLSTLEQVLAIRPTWEALQAESDSRTDIEADFDRYISVVESDRTCEPYVLLLFKEGAPHAMWIGTLGPVRIWCKFGYLNILKPTLFGARITYGGYLGDFSEQTCNHLLDHLSTSLCDDGMDVVRFEQLPRHSQLYSLVRKRPSILCRSRFPKFDKHWQMDIPDRMESFYAQHSSKTRQTLKRYIRKLEKNHQVHMLECTDSQTMLNVLPISADISKRTYQHALGWGLMDDAVTRRQLQTVARSGWLRFHVLYLDDAPCAFQYGFQYQGTYYLKTMGFNPDLRKSHIGTVLFLKIIECLCEDPAVDRFDFGYGDAEYKRRFATEHWDEATLYMFAPRAYPAFVNSIHTVVNGLSLGMRWLVHKAGVEGKIKQKWRRRLQKSQNADSK
jgi:hypothetical protein